MIGSIGYPPSFLSLISSHVLFGLLTGYVLRHGDGRRVFVILIHLGESSTSRCAARRRKIFDARERRALVVGGAVEVLGKRHGRVLVVATDGVEVDDAVRGDVEPAIHTER